MQQPTDGLGEPAFSAPDHRPQLIVVDRVPIGGLMLRRSSSNPGGSPQIRLEGFEAFEPIGSGGYSRVYRARQTDFGREVALKVLSVGLETEAQQRSFERECRAMGSLSEHPNIVTIFSAAFTADQQPCIVMEFYPEGTLGDLVSQQGPMTVDELLSVGIEISGALETAHRRGVVHRDIKPQNLFMSEYGRSALGDFGISSFDDERTITGGGGGLTVHYAPPELIEGEPATAASDVYSLAATLFSLATGQRPFRRGPDQSVGELARRILIEPAPRLPTGYGPTSLSDLLHTAMSKRPQERPSPAVAFGRELQAIERELGLSETSMPLVLDPTPEPAAKRVDPGGRQNLGGGMTTTTTVSRHPLVLAGSSELGPESAPSTTPGRAQATLNAPTHSEASELGGARKARSAAMAAAVVACGIAVLAFFALLGSTEAPDEAFQEPIRSPETTESFFSTPSSPRGVGVTASSDGGTVVVTWDAVEGAEGYQIQRLDDGSVIEVSESTASLAIELGELPCVEIRAIGSSGKLSPASDAVCAQP